MDACGLFEESGEKSVILTYVFGKVHGVTFCWAPGFGSHNTVVKGHA